MFGGSKRLSPWERRQKEKSSLSGCANYRICHTKPHFNRWSKPVGVCWIFSCGFCGVQRRLNSTPHVKISFYFTTFSEDRISPEGVDVGAAPRKKKVFLFYDHPESGGVGLAELYLRYQLAQPGWSRVRGAKNVMLWPSCVCVQFFGWGKGLKLDLWGCFS